MISEVKTWRQQAQVGLSHPGSYIKEEMESGTGASVIWLSFLAVQNRRSILFEWKAWNQSEMQKLLERRSMSCGVFCKSSAAYDLAQARKPDPSVAARRQMQTAYPCAK